MAYCRTTISAFKYRVLDLPIISVTQRFLTHSGSIGYFKPHVPIDYRKQFLIPVVLDMFKASNSRMLIPKSLFMDVINF